MIYKATVLILFPAQKHVTVTTVLWSVKQKAVNALNVVTGVTQRSHESKLDLQPVNWLLGWTKHLRPAI